MQVASWIKDACRTATSTADVYNRYQEFIDETGSTMSQDTFKRRVRDAFYDVSGQQPAPTDKKAGITAPRIITEADGPNLTIISRSSQIRTLDQLLAYTRTDLSRWKVAKHLINPWGSESYECFQVKAWLEPKEPEVDPRIEVQSMIAEAKRYAPSYPNWTPKQRPDSGNLLELSLFDHHFGQLSWGRETRGQNYDARISRRLALDSVDYILSRAMEVKLDRILIPVGNDFFNVNSMLNVTARGTPQSEDDRWRKTFVQGRQLWVEIIERCMTIAPVTVIGMPGNHDEERSFYLVDSLACWFQGTDQVIVDNEPQDRKYFQWGKCMIGFTHGHKERRKLGVLINLMATEEAVMWASTHYHEWHKGHFHASSSKAFQYLDEELGVRERVLPSLVPLDEYHSGKGYSHLRESIGLIWHREMGNTDQFNYHPSTPKMGVF